MVVVKKSLGELHKSEKNVRRHTPMQIREYVRSVKMFGQTKPIICDENGVIIVGNGLYEALNETGAAEADCVVMAGLSDKQKKKLMLADNRVYELGITDTAVFEDIIKDLDGDTDVPGWEEDILKMLNASVAEIDQQISSYGVFASEDVERFNATAPQTTTTQQPQAQPYYQPPQAPSPQTPVGQTSQDAQPYQYQPYQAPVQPAAPAATMNDMNDAQSAEVRRYITCPHCGGRICL